MQLQKVILNLIMNAVEAMSGDSEGPRELLISTRKEGPSGVLVVLQDSGPGLKPRVGHGIVNLPLDRRSSRRTGVDLSPCRTCATIQFTLPVASAV